ncbi:MAG: MFS transporter [Candidatus Paceibacterota bacterium]
MIFHRPKHIFNYFIHRSVDEIYYSVGLRRFGIQLIGLYEPIFLYTFFGNSLSKVFLFYAFILGGHSLLVPLGGRLMARYGVKHSMLLSIPFLMAFYLLLFFSGKMAWLIYLAPIAATLYRITFLPAFHADFAKLSSRKKRGKQLSFLNVITLAGSVAGPLIGAFILTEFGFHILFIIVTIILLLSMIPLILSIEIKPHYQDSYKSAIGLIFKKGWRLKTLSLMLYGVDSGISTIFWPLFLFIIAINYANLGIISSISLLLSLVIIFYTAHATDKYDKIKVFRSGCFLASLGQIAKIFVQGAPSAVAAQSFLQIGDTLDTTPLTAYIYDTTQRERIHEGRFIVFCEVVQNLGTFFIYAFAGFFFLLFPDSRIVIFFPIAALSIFLAGILGKVFEKRIAEHKDIIKGELGEHM